MGRRFQEGKSSKEKEETGKRGEGRESLVSFRGESRGRKRKRRRKGQKK